MKVVRQYAELNIFFYTSECECLWFVTIFSINKIKAKLSIVIRKGYGNISFLGFCPKSFDYSYFSCDSGNKCKRATDKNNPPEKAWEMDNNG